MRFFYIKETVPGHCFNTRIPEVPTEPLILVPNIFQYGFKYSRRLFGKFVRHTLWHYHFKTVIALAVVQI